MSRIDLFELRNTFEAQGVMMCFNGPFSHSVIEQLGSALRQYLQSDEAPRDRVGDVFSVFIEQAQNIRNYTAKVESDPADPYPIAGSGTLAIGREGDVYIVVSGNPVEALDAESLRERLSELQTLDAAGLKARYKQVLRAPRDEDSGGAGLGFISMARTARSPIQFDLRELSENRYFFTIRVEI